MTQAKRFKPVEGYKVEIEKGTDLILNCRDGKKVDIDVGGFGQYKTFLQDIDLDDFICDVKALDMRLLISPKKPTYRLLEWDEGDRLTIRQKGWMLRFDTDRSQIQSFIERASEFLAEVKEHQDAQVA